MADARVEALAALEVQDVEGKPVRLGTLWKDGPIVLALIRHFG